MAGQQRCLVMVPLKRDQLRALRDGGGLPGPLPGVTPSAALAETFDLPLGKDTEDTEAAALQVADVYGLCAVYDGPQPGQSLVWRCVVVASAPVADVTPVASDEANGRVQMDGLATLSVQSIFEGWCDDAVATAAKGLDIDSAWSLPSVQTMLAEAPLAWHDRSELSVIV